MSTLARVRDPARGPAGDALPPLRGRDAQQRAVVALWALLVVVAAAVLAVHRARPLPGLPESLVAGVLTTLLAGGLAWRVGGRPLVTALLTAALVTVAVLGGWPVLIAGAALATVVTGAALAVLLTVPARSLLAVVREVLVALAVAAVAALAAAAYDAPVEPSRLRYAALVLALALAVVVVHRPAGGIHALGRTGALLVVGALALLVLSLAYTWALQRWGSPALTDAAAALPSPLQALVGVPALVVGVAVRDRRRQGWWVCAFGVTATVPVAAGLAAGQSPATLALATAYAAGAGLVLGLLVLGVLRLMRRIPPARHRPEPPRSHALR